MVMKSVEFVYFVCLGIKYLSFLIKMSSSIENLPLDKLSRGKCMSLFDPLKCKAGLLTHSLTHLPKRYERDSYHGVNSVAKYRMLEEFILS